MKTCRLIATVFFCACFVFISANVFAQEKASVLPQGSYRDIYEMLRNVPGLEVKSNGSNGKGSVTVRGVSSLTQQGQPIFVIDGSIYTGDISNLNPQDIESISVLKDAATAYGSRGMFGVIIITSKQGKNAATASVTATNYEGSAYAYFIEHKTPLKVFDMNEAVIIEGVIQKQKGDSLVFTKKRKDFLVAISAIKRVEMIPQQ